MIPGVHEYMVICYTYNIDYSRHQTLSKEIRAYQPEIQKLSDFVDKMVKTGVARNVCI